MEENRMREIAIHFLLGALAMEFSVLYCILKKEFKNKMDERTITVKEEE
jgi:hypothetical protein